MKGQDIVILLKLASLQDQAERTTTSEDLGRLDDNAAYSVRGLEARLGVSKSEVNASIQRSLASGLAVRDQGSGRAGPHRRNLHDFITHGLKFVFPANPGALTRGVPTAFAAPMLESRLHSAGAHIHVWPAADGTELGQTVEPLFRTVPAAVAKDARLYEYLALVDAVRLGNAREAGLAGDVLRERLLRA